MHKYVSPYPLSITAIWMQNTHSCPEVLKHINRILREIECIRFGCITQEDEQINFGGPLSEHNNIGPRSYLLSGEYARWNVEYGTISKLHTLEPSQRSMYFECTQFIFPLVCRTAIQWFPHNAPVPDAEDDDDELQQYPVFVSPFFGQPIHNKRRDDSHFYRKWCAFEISLLFGSLDGSLGIDFRRIAGDRNAYHWTYDYMRVRIHEEINLQSRINFILFVEGHSPETSSGHIERYLFDPMIMRELCSFIN